MMKQDTKLILKNSLIFGTLLAVLNIILSLILQQLHFGASQTELLLTARIEIYLWYFLSIAVLIWALIRVRKRLEKLSYWKLALTGIGIVVLTYHLFYLYTVIDYYIIHEPPKASGNTLENLLTLMEAGPKPRYSPYYDLIGSLIDDLNFGIYDEVLVQLFFGGITLPLWISAGVFLIHRRTSKTTNESSLIDQ